MDSWHKDYRSRLIAQHPELKEALEQLSPAEFKILIDAFDRLALSVEATRKQLHRTQDSLLQPGPGGEKRLH